jgi:GDP-L-fucose synthase
MKIAILGANGFVGTNVAETLQSYGFDIFKVSRHNGYDLTKLEDNTRYLKSYQPDIIINCAAHVGSLNYVTEFAADVISDNTKMISNLYESVRLLNPSIIILQPLANCAYPASAVTYKEEEFWNGPLHPSVKSYGFTRRLMWTMAECYKMQYGIKSVNLVTPNMYGPHDSTDPNKAHALNALVSKFVKAIHTKQQGVEIWGTGVAVREWLFSGDFSRIVLNVLKEPGSDKFNEPVNIAQEYGLSVKELIDLILKYVPYTGNIWYNSAKPDGAPRKVMDKSRFEKIFPDFEFTSFQKGIEATAEYYQSVFPY